MRDRCNYLSFWAIFCPYTPLTARKRKIYKKWNKHLEISSFYTSVQKTMIRWRTVPEIWWMADLIVISHFGLFSPFYIPPKSQKKSKFWKNEKNAWRYHHFRNVYQKLWSEDVQFLRYAARQMDRQMDGRMDGWKMWHIEVGASPKNMKVLLNLIKDFTLLIMFNILVSK